MGGELHINWRPGKADRTIWRFVRSDAIVRAFMGPIGGGKTSACLMQIPIRAIRQEPSLIDGVRRTRWAVFRDTYRNLERTTIPTWNEWVPKGAGEWRGGANGEPGIHKISFPLGDGTTVEFEVLFIAVGDRTPEDVARGFEITGAMINEGDRVVPELLQYLLGRIGRYPAMRHGGPSWYGVWLDFNAPDFDNYTYKTFVEKKPDSFEFFQQPGGTDGAAENLQNLRGGREYYEKQVEGQPDWWVRRMVHNQFGYSREGQPVYMAEFSDQRHVAKRPLKVIRNKPMWIGLDAGRHPAAAIMQADREGQLRVLNEFVCHWMGAREFGHQLRMFLAELYPDQEMRFRCDPAAFNPTELSENAEDVWVEIVSRELGTRVRQAKSQRADARREALRKQMKHNITADKSGLVIDPRCHIIRRGLNNTFRFKRIGNASSEKFSNQVEKNKDSHICEALEYGALSAVGFDEYIGGVGRRVPADVVTDFRVPGF